MKTKTSLTDLNEYLFGTLDDLTNDDLTDEELERAIKKAGAITNVAGTIIANAQTQLKACVVAREAGVEIHIPKLLSGV